MFNFLGYVTLRQPVFSWLCGIKPMIFFDFEALSRLIKSLQFKGHLRIDLKCSIILSLNELFCLLRVSTKIFVHRGCLFWNSWHLKYLQIYYLPVVSSFLYRLKHLVDFVGYSPCPESNWRWSVAWWGCRGRSRCRRRARGGWSSRWPSTAFRSWPLERCPRL